MSVQTQDAQAWPLPRPQHWMVQVWAAWLALYFLVPLISSGAGPGLFAATVDRVDSIWLSSSVLNLPLQLVCMSISLVLLRQGGRSSRRASTGFGVAATGLVLAHLSLSLGLEMSRIAGSL